MSATATGSEGLVPVAGRHSAVVDQNCFRHQTSGSQDPGRRQVRSSGPARNIRVLSLKISFPRSEALFSPCKRVYFIQLDLLTAGEVLLICWSLRLSCTRWTDEKASRQSESKARRWQVEAFGCPWRPYPTQTHTAGASDLCCRCLNERD